MPSPFILKNLPSRRELEKISALFPGMNVDAVEVFMALMRLAGDLLDASDAQLSPRGLSQGKLSLLVQVYRGPAGGLACCELAEGIGVARPTITGLLDGLERDGLVRRAAAAADRRSLRIVLTPKGRKIVASVMPERLSWIAQVVAPLSAKERAALLSLLNKVSGGLAK